MKKELIASILIFFLLFGCELIRLTEKTKRELKPDPSNSIGTVLFFIQEVKKNNFHGVDRLFVSEDSTLSLEKVLELQGKIERFGRSIDNREITSFKIDTLNSNEHMILLEFDYLYRYFFVTRKQDDIWLIRTFGKQE